jgi:hypothetical protein
VQVSNDAAQNKGSIALKQNTVSRVMLSQSTLSADLPSLRGAAARTRPREGFQYRHPADSYKVDNKQQKVHLQRNVLVCASAYEKTFSTTGSMCCGSTPSISLQIDYNGTYDSAKSLTALKTYRKAPSTGSKLSAGQCTE